MKRFIFVAVIVFLIFIINNLAQSTYSLWQKKDVLVEAKQDLSKEQKENNELKEQLKVVKSPQFVESQARDKLLLVKPGENIVVVPTGLIAREQPKAVKKTPPKPNWLQWWELFFKS